jgi:hypothetical protein
MLATALTAAIVTRQLHARSENGFDELTRLIGAHD